VLGRFLDEPGRTPLSGWANEPDTIDDNDFPPDYDRYTFRFTETGSAGGYAAEGAYTGEIEFTVTDRNDNPITDPGSGTFDATSVSNQVHALTIQATTTWSNGATDLTLDQDGNPGVNQISLKADDDATVADAQFVTSTAADITGHSTDSRDTRDTSEAGTVTPIGLFLDLGTISAGSDFEGTFTIIVDGG